MGANITVTFQNPGMLKGVMQKVNPFKSTSQVPALVKVYAANFPSDTVTCFY